MTDRAGFDRDQTALQQQNQLRIGTLAADRAELDRDLAAFRQQQQRLDQQGRSGYTGKQKDKIQDSILRSMSAFTILIAERIRFIPIGYSSDPIRSFDNGEL